MKISKKIVSLLLSLMFVCSFSVPTTAANENIPLSNGERELLQEMGFLDGIIEIMPRDEALHHISAYQNDPSKVSVHSSVLTINQFEELCNYKSMTYNDKLNAGLSEQDILQIDNTIAQVASMSDADLIHCGIPEDEIPLYRGVLENNIIPYGEGDITDAELDFSMVVHNLSTDDCPYYEVFIYFNWSQLYLWGAFDDKVIVACGGNLNRDGISSEVTYCTFDTLTGWKDITRTSDMSYYVDEINGSGYYYFEQSDNAGYKAKNGAISFELSQLSYQNVKTEIISQYAHQVLSVSGATIDITILDPKLSSVSIEVGPGYDTCEQEIEDIIA